MDVLSSEKKHFVTLEWFRFILSLYIVVFHTFNYKSAPKFIREIFETGFFATSSFFILSGFILAHVYLKGKGTNLVTMREKPKEFLIKRFANLWPIHIISMIIFFAIILSLPFLAINPKDLDSSIRFVVYDATNGMPYEELVHYMSNKETMLALLMNVFMIHSWNPYYLMFNFPTWSISTLFFFYLMFPLIAVRIHKIKKPLFFLFVLNFVALVPVFICLIFTDMSYPEAGFLHRNPIVRLPEFIAGILLCYIYHKNRMENKLPDFKKMIYIFITIIIGLTLARMFVYAMANYWNSWNIAYHLMHNGLILSLEMLIIYFIVNLPNITKQKWINISERLGGSSLPMFALHMPIFYVFIRIQKVLEGDPSLCLTDFRACMNAANQEPNYMFYLFYIIVTIYLCVKFQEKVVIPIRKTIIKKTIG